MNESLMVNKLSHLVFLNQKIALLGVLSHYTSTFCNSCIKLWTLQNKEEINLFGLKNDEYVDQVVVNQDEEKIIVKSFTYTKGNSNLQLSIGCYDLLRRSWLWNFNPKEYLNDTQIRSIFFLEKTAKIVILTEEYIFYLDSKSGKILDKKKSMVREFKIGGEVLHSYVRASKSGRYFVIWNEYFGGGIFPSWFYSKENKYFIVYDVVEEKEVIKVDKPGGGINEMIFTEDEQNLLFTSVDRKIRLWSIKENKLVKEVKGWANFMVASRDKIVLVDMVKNISVLKYPGFEEEKTFGQLVYSIKPSYPTIALTSNGKLMAFEKEGQLHLFKTENWQEIWKVPTCREDTLNN